MLLVLVLPLAALLVLYLVMIALIFGAGAIEGRKRPQEQGRPDSVGNPG